MKLLVFLTLLTVGALTSIAAFAHPAFGVDPPAAADETIDWMAIIVSICQNPPLLAALMTLGYNVGLYVAACAHSRKIEPYDIGKLVETLAVFETVILLTQGLAGAPASWAATLGLILNFVWSLKKVLSDFAKVPIEAKSNVEKSRG